MEKILNKLRQDYYANKTDATRSKIKFSQSYLPVYKENLALSVNNKLDKLKFKHDKQLHDAYDLTLSQSQYLDKYSEADLAKLDNKLYWKNRRINHKYSKLINKTVDSEKVTILEEEKKEKLQQIDAWFNDQKSLITNKYTITRDTETIKTNQATYDNLKSLLTSEFEEKRDELNLLSDEKYAKFEEKQVATIKRLESQLVILKEKLNHYINLNGAKQEIDQEVILEVNNLTMQFGGLKAVNDLSFNVKKGEIFGLIGPNGAGKTTVFNCITQFYKPTSGDIFYRNVNDEVVNLNNYKVHNVIRQGIVRTFQNVELVWELSILDNMLVGSHSVYRTGFFSHIIQSLSFRREEQTLKSKAMKILTDLGIDNYAHFYPLGLPYGVLKKIELARTLMTNPNLIILDEPAAGLNEGETAELARTIKKIKDEYQCTIFLVEHDMGLVMDICDRICAISFGQLLSVGKPKEIQNNKLVQEAYLGGE